MPGRRKDRPLAIPLRRAVGLGAQNLREVTGRTQEEVARVARNFGLAWDRTKVAALERGDKSVSAEELVTLLLVFREITGRAVRLPELLGGGDIQIALPSRLDLSGNDLADLLAGKVTRRVAQATTEITSIAALAPNYSPATEPNATLERHLELAQMAPGAFMSAEQASAYERAVNLGLGDVLMEEIRRNEPFAGEAEEKAARKLGEPKAVIVAAAVKLWGWTLTQERNMRTLRQRPDEASQRAVRGHVTRELLSELVELLEPATKRGAIDFRIANDEDEDD